MHFSSDLQHPFNSSNESTASLEKKLSIVPISAKLCYAMWCGQLPTSDQPEATKLQSEPCRLEVRSLLNIPRHHFTSPISYLVHSLIKSKQNKSAFKVNSKPGMRRFCDSSFQTFPWPWEFLGLNTGADCPRKNISMQTNLSCISL